MTDFDERKQSEFSGDVNYLNRLNVLLALCSEHSTELNVFDWFHVLMALKRELSTEMKVSKTTKENIELKECDKFSNKIRPLITNYLNEQKRGRGEISVDLYDELDKFEIYLRKIIKESGLQNKMKDYAGAVLR